jgi:hypothetical protein
MIKIEKLVLTMSAEPFVRLLHPKSSATKPLEHAVSSCRFGPCRSKNQLRRPESSDGRQLSDILDIESKSWEITDR